MLVIAFFCELSINDVSQDDLYRLSDSFAHTYPLKPLGMHIRMLKDVKISDFESSK